MIIVILIRRESDDLHRDIDPSLPKCGPTSLTHIVKMKQNVQIKIGILFNKLQNLKHFPACASEVVVHLNSRQKNPEATCGFGFI